MIMEADNESAAGNQPHTEGWTDGDRAGAASSPSPSSPPGGSDHMIQANTIKVEAPSDDEELEPSAGMAAPGSRHGGDARWSGAREAAGGEHGALDGIGGGETPGSGKLACDICGLVCVGPNVLLVHKRSHTGERPFQCGQCGASFTQKGNLLRHVKLHSGEKPFKCHMCNYACRRRDALAGHLKTHAIGKPHKCAYCGRSYKQRSSLEEHKERCHAYLQHAAVNGPHAAPPDAESRPAQEGRGAESEQELERGGAAPADRTPASNLGKRKSFTPQKFIVEKHWRSSGGPDVRIPAPQPFPKEQELVPPLIMSYLGASGLAGDLSHGPYAGMMCQPYGLPLPLPPRSNTPINRGGAVDGHGGIAEGLCFPTKSSSRAAAAAAAAAAASAAAADASSPDNGENNNNNNSGGAFNNNNNNSGQESTDEDGSLAGDRNGVQEMKDEEEGAKQQRRPQRRRDRDVFRVFRPDGTSVRSYRCTHCEVLFLDHVMYTIHMGCHGYREPLECNVCGHLSRDRYEFSSHIVRGEHSRSLD